MSELFLTVGGVVVAGLTAVYSTVIDSSKSAAQRWILVMIAGIALGLGILGAVSQQKDGDDAKNALTNLQTRVGTLDRIDRDIKARSEDLTKLNLLGGASYYIVIGTYPSTATGNTDFDRVLANVKTLFPDADKNGMIWKHFKPNGQFEMGFGRNLSPAAAEIYLQLADYLAKAQSPMIRLER